MRLFVSLPFLFSSMLSSSSILLLFLFLHIFLSSVSSSSVVSLTSSFTSLDPLFQTWIQFSSVALVHFSNHPYCNICKELCAFFQTIRTNSTTMDFLQKPVTYSKIFSLSLKSKYLSMNIRKKSARVIVHKQVKRLSHVVNIQYYLM